MWSTADKSNACHIHCPWLSYRHLPIYDAFSLVGVFGNASCGRDGTDKDSFFVILFHLDNYFHVIFAENEWKAITHIRNYLISNPNTYLSSVTNIEPRGLPLVLVPPHTKHSICLLFVVHFHIGTIQFICLLANLYHRDHSFNSEPEWNAQQFSPQFESNSVVLRVKSIVCI